VFFPTECVLRRLAGFLSQGKVAGPTQLWLAWQAKLRQRSGMTQFQDQARAAERAMRAVFPATPLLRNAHL
jgi:hypothetical protein